MGRATVAGSVRQWPFLAVLAAQNVALFRAHYFGTAGIPWDFSMGYYAMVAFWTAVVRDGVFPQWIPFQQMGYPFALQVQSGMNYLPLWIFPALNLPYTLRAAIVFQCLHVLVGAIGMFLLARRVQPSRGLALVAAIAFQCFGGFYSNAEHVDIVRAFAFAPWLLYVYSLDDITTARLPRRAILIPPVLYLFLTGSYPGNVISAGVIITLLCGLQLLDALIGGARPRHVIAIAMRIVGWSVIGCGLASLHLGPLALFREQYIRGEPLLTVPRIGLWLEHLPGLFLSNASLPGEISMTSTYVSLPVLWLACFAPKAAFRKHWVYAAVAAVAALMAAGDHTFLGPLLRTHVPLLGLSRFPSSDYRVFVAIPLILFSLSGLAAVVTGQLSRRSVAVRSVLCVTWVVWGLSSVPGGTSRDAMLAGSVAAASLLTILGLSRKPAGLTAVPLAAICVLISLDAVRVLPNIVGWHEPDMDANYARMGYPPYTRNRGRRLASSYIVRNVPSTRPARIRPVGLIRWSGYLDGTYLVTDLTPNVLRAASLVPVNDGYDSYMLKRWSPLLFAQKGAPGVTKIELSAAEWTSALAGTPTIENGSVRQTRYGINDIEYQVSVRAPQLLVENEMYFPGWRARLSTVGAREIEAVEVNGVFRGWRLPAGEYAMTASFELPHLLALRLVSCASFLIWIGLCAAVRPRSGSAHSP